MNALSLMCILAHPDDESMGTGGLLAKYVAEGVTTSLLTATRGERGWTGPEEDYPGPKALGQIREAELLAAAKVLGLSEIHFLDYVDGDLDQANPAAVIAKIVGHVRRLRPQVVVTFGPDGAYGHPDHIAICQLTTAALVCAADPTYPDPANHQPAHQVAKLYYMVESPEMVELAESLIGGISITVDGIERHQVAWPEWAITTRIDATAYWPVVVEAVACHRSQISDWPPMESWPAEILQQVWGRPTLYRAYSLVNGGRQVEDDLFAGLR